MRTETLSNLKINKLSQKQYDRELANGNIDENAIYLTPDTELDLAEVEQTLKEQGDEIEVVKGDLTSHTNSSNAQFALVREEFVDADTETLKSAKDYSDANKNSAISEAKAYTDQEIEKLVTDTEFEGVLSTIQDIQNAMATDEELAQALETANGKKVDKGAKGSATQPIYFDDNGAQPIAYTIEKSVPADAKFTDTTYTLIKDSTNKKIQLMNGETLVSEVDDNNTTYGVVTQESSGLMSKEDKVKLDGISEEIDDKLSFDKEVVNSTRDVTKIVPEGSGKYAAVNKVGGMSYKSRNLLEVTAITQTVDGIAITVNTDKSVTYKGTATKTFNTPLSSSFYIPKGKYKMLGGTWSIELLIPDKSPQYYTSQTFEVTEDGCRIYPYKTFYSGATVNETIYPMLLEATETNTSYEPYYSGLRNSYVSKIKSQSKNILNVTGESQTINGVTFTVNADKTITISGTATDRVIFYLAKRVVGNLKGYKALCMGGNICIDTYDINDNYVAFIDSHSGIITKDTARYTVYILIAKGVYLNNSTFYPMIIKGEVTNTEYEPYKAIEPFTIPTGAKGEGYGLGINESCYNYIDFERKVYVKRCEKVDLGSLDWTLKGSYYWQTDSLKGLIKPAKDNYTIPNILAENYSNAKWQWGTQRNCIAVEYTGAVACENLSTTEKPTGYLVYELATPIETDISDYIQDNFIEVAEGGVITTVNEYNYNVPTEISFFTSENPEKVIVADTFVGDLVGVAEEAQTLTGLESSIAELNFLKGAKGNLQTQIDQLDAGTSSIIIDSELNASSENPVQNKVINSALANKVDKVNGKGLSTNDYTTTEKNKLAGIASGANAYTHPTTAGNKHIPSGGSSGQILTYSASGTAKWADPPSTSGKIKPNYYTIAPSQYEDALGQIVFYSAESDSYDKGVIIYAGILLGIFNGTTYSPAFIPSPVSTDLVSRLTSISNYVSPMINTPILTVPSGEIYLKGGLSISTKTSWTTFPELFSMCSRASDAPVTILANNALINNDGMVMYGGVAFFECSDSTLVEGFFDDSLVLAASKGVEFSIPFTPGSSSALTLDESAIEGS